MKKESSIFQTQTNSESPPMIQIIKALVCVMIKPSKMKKQTFALMSVVMESIRVIGSESDNEDTRIRIGMGFRIASVDLAKA